MGQIFRNIVALRWGYSRSVALLCMVLLTMTVLCTFSSTAIHKQQSTQPSEHRNTSFGCIVKYLGSNAGDISCEAPPLESSFLLVSQPLRPFPDRLTLFVLSNAGESPPGRVRSPVDLHVSLLI